MTRSSLPFLILLLAGIGPLPAEGRPNIVFILADDLGWNDVSFRGGDIPTPNIDRIASDGVVLDRFYTCPVCSPTRAGLMTGRYPIRFGMQRAVCRPFLEVGVPAAEETLPEMLGRAGYRHRGAVGKWHIGHAFRRFHPLNQGFGFFVGHFNGNIDYYTHHREGELDWHRGFEPNFDEGYSTDLIADEAVGFINRNAGEGPFFLFVPFNAPHTPLQVPDEWLPAFASTIDERRRIYMAMVAAMDYAIGRILGALRRQDIEEDTLVWFASDNGGPGRLGDNTPLRGSKGTLYEGGIRVASALRWPRVVPGNGRTVAGLISYLDVFPTLRRVAGMGSADGPGEPLDGEDVLDLILGREEPRSRRLYSYFESYGDERLAVIDGEWKLVRRGPPVLGENPADAPPPGHTRGPATAERIELFNLDRDPHETTDLSSVEPQRRQAMLQMARSFRGIRQDGGVPPMVAPAPAGWKAPPNWRMAE